MRDPRTPDCKIRGCTRAAGSSGLCAKHVRYVPLADAMALSVAIAENAHAIAVKHHKRWVKTVQAQLDDHTAIERPRGYMSSAQATGQMMAARKR